MSCGEEVPILRVARATPSGRDATSTTAAKPPMALDLKLRAAFARSIRDVDAASESGGDPSQKRLLAEKGKKGLEEAYQLLQRARAQV